MFSWEGDYYFRFVRHYVSKYIRAYKFSPLHLTMKKNFLWKTKWQFFSLSLSINWWDLPHAFESFWEMWKITSSNGWWRVKMKSSYLIFDNLSSRYHWSIKITKSFSEIDCECSSKILWLIFIMLRGSSRWCSFVRTTPVKIKCMVAPREIESHK